MRQAGKQAPAERNRDYDDNIFPFGRGQSLMEIFSGLKKNNTGQEKELREWRRMKIEAKTSK